ncbi:MAG: MOSC domain-containing protein YiiM [Arenicella sp.]
MDTGIFKYAVEGSIQLGNEDVVGDNVIERKYHGGVHKACYIYSADHYSYWKDLYPDLDFENGMFGENITIEGLDEANIHLGDIYQVGSAKVEVSQPREPCYKLGIRFNTQKILKQFINAPYPGVYLRVIEKGEVKAGDEMVQIKEGPAFANLKDVYYLLYQSKKSDQDKIETVLELTNLPPDLRRNLEKRLNLKKMTD